MEAAEQSFQRDLQHVKFCDMKLHATIRSGSEAADKLNGKREDLVYGAVQLESVALRLNRDVFERGIGRRTGVKVVADVPYVGVDDAFLDLKKEGLRVVEGRVDLLAGANHLSTNPADIDAEVGAFAEKEIVGVDQGRGEVIKGGSVGCADVEGRDPGGWRGSGYPGPRIPEETADAENGDRNSGGDAGREGTGH